MTELNSSNGQCSPCMFVMGMFAGYIASTILNALGNASSQDEGVHPKSPSLSNEVEIDDEGNVIDHRPSLANGGGMKTDESKAPSNEERTVTQSAPPSKAIESSTANATVSSEHGAIKLVNANENTNATVSSEHGPVKLVIQRFRSASLLLSPNETAHINQSAGDQAQPSCGMLVYVSFSKAAESNRSAIFSAARTLLNLSVLTRGVWGDGSGTVSALVLATELDKAKSAASSTSSGVPIVVVPQANLISKVKNNGKSIQYHEQVAKATGKEIYDIFVRSVQLIAYEHQCLARGEEISESLRKALADVGGSTSNSSSSKGSGTQAIDSSIAPRDMFRDATLYESWDDDGIPLAMIGGFKPTKSSIKKMKKQQLAQKKRYEKYLALGDTAKDSLGDTSGNNGTEKDGREDIVKKLDDGFVNVVAGTFGNLQALSFDSPMGPMCHLVNIS